MLPSSSSTARQTSTVKIEKVHASVCCCDEDVNEKKNTVRLICLIITWTKGRTPGDLAQKFNQSDAFKVILQAQGVLPLDEEAD